MTRCGHCGRPRGSILETGYATVNDTFLCHPDEGMDCYRLVTVYGHEMPCGRDHSERATWIEERRHEALLRLLRSARTMEWRTGD